MNIEFNIRKLSKYEVAEFESLREEAENLLNEKCCKGKTSCIFTYSRGLLYFY